MPGKARPTQFFGVGVGTNRTERNCPCTIDIQTGLSPRICGSDDRLSFGALAAGSVTSPRGLRNAAQSL
jgi:hypothetical protein